MTIIKLNELKKSIKEYDQKELIQLLSELYKLNSEVKHYLSSKFLGEVANEDLFLKAKMMIRNEFFPERGFGKMRLSEAKAAITNFKKITHDSVRTMDLMLYYVEVGTEFTCSYGDINAKFYESMNSMYDRVISECEEDQTLFAQFKDRLYSVVVESADIGWGYHDVLVDSYYSLQWIVDEEN